MFSVFYFYLHCIKKEDYNPSMLATYVAYITKTNLFHIEQQYLEVVPIVLTLVKMLIISSTLPVIYMILYKQQPQEFFLFNFCEAFCNLICRCPLEIRAIIPSLCFSLT